ncbi:MAG: hypothetical protein ABFE13_04770 [Phycisphaerales bacterium]
MPATPGSGRWEGWVSLADPASRPGRSDTVGLVVRLWLGDLRSFIRRVSEPRLVAESDDERAASGVFVKPLEGLVAAGCCVDSLLGEMRRTRELSRVVPTADRVELSLDMELTRSDESDGTVPLPIWLPMLLVASEPTPTGGEDRSAYDLRLGERVALLGELSLAEGIEADGCDGLVVNDLLRLGDGLERTDGIGSLEPIDGADRLTDGLGRLKDALGDRLGLADGLGLMDRLGLGATDRLGLGATDRDCMRLIPLGALDLGAGLTDRDGLGAARFTVDGLEDIRGDGAALGAWLLELGREASEPERLRPRGWP